MAERLELHPTTPQMRLLRIAAECLRDGGVIVYPTDSCYALGCAIGAKVAMERIQRIRQAGKRHFFTIICRDLSEISRFARVENWQYRLLKAFTPGPYTFVLQAKREVPRRLLDERRRTVGIRVPEQERPPGADEVEVAATVHVDELVALASRDEPRISSDGRERAYGRVHPAGDRALRALEQSTRLVHASD